MCEPNEMDPAVTQLEQDLQADGWLPVEMIEPATGMPFTRWFPPGKPLPSIYRELVADNMDFPLDFENGPEPLGDDR